MPTCASSSRCKNKTQISIERNFARNVSTAPALKRIDSHTRPVSAGRAGSKCSEQQQQQRNQKVKNMTQQHEYTMVNQNSRILPTYKVQMTRQGDTHKDGTPVDLVKTMFKVFNVETQETAYCETLEEAQRISWLSIATPKTPVLDALRKFVVEIVREEIEDLDDAIRSATDRIDDIDMTDIEDDVADLKDKVERINEFDSTDIEERLNAVEEKVEDAERAANGNESIETLNNVLMDICSVIERRVTSNRIGA